MIFPITITKRIVFKRNEYNLTSNKDLLNIIEEHMQQFGMFKARAKDNELFYMKLDSLLLLSGNYLRNILFTINSNNEEVRIDIKTNTLRILLPSCFLAIGFFLSKNSIEKSFIWFLLSLGLVVFAWLYLKRFLTLVKIRNEVFIKMRKFKK